MRTLYHKKGQERGFFQTYNYDSDKLNVYGQTKHIISIISLQYTKLYV